MVGRRGSRRRRLAGTAAVRLARCRGSAARLSSTTGGPTAPVHRASDGGAASSPGRGNVAPMTAPLFVTADESLLDELLRLAAAAGTTPDVAHDVPAALRACPRAPLVLVGE